MAFMQQAPEGDEAFKCFNAVFNKGCKVTLHGLKTERFNSKKGKITKELSTANPERYGVLVDGEKKAILLKPSNLMTVEGIPPTFAFKQDGMVIPLKAKLGVSPYYNETGFALVYSDHMGLDALRPIRNRFFNEEDALEDVVGQAFAQPTTCLQEYRAKPGQVAIPMYKHEDVAKCMQQAGLIQMTGQKVKQGFGEFSIAKIKFQRMFYHDTF